MFQSPGGFSIFTRFAKANVCFIHTRATGKSYKKIHDRDAEGVGGTYKAILFCSELEQAKQSATVLTGLTEACSYETKISIKRGCSEFAASFPQYKETSGDKFGSFLYPQQWAKIEDEFDEANPNILRRVNPSMPHVALHDLCIVRKWIDYAKGLGDASVPKFSTLEISIHMSSKRCSKKNKATTRSQLTFT